ncbi:Serine/threonine-protein kinase Nek11 [Channa argus]|uniref:non-specific serine/threonine protein kinase n=1 Tax=Channa argus TaxID=215402 RepID=A0A6G1PQN8_CHAAH|nr:Serine/threonine-protein kinase Nek11 [Channa argus]
MPRYQEVESGEALVAKRYKILQTLGRGSFGSVYLVHDNKATDGEQLSCVTQLMNFPVDLLCLHLHLKLWCLTAELTEELTAADAKPAGTKALKQIPLGDLRPDETVRATQEAQLLSQLHHPAILTFHHSFLERDSFCIITEYCQDRDLDCKLEELRRAGGSLPETQVIDWLIQLLLGLHYMHDRRILHRDLKAKNVFLKRNLVKIGDFGVSCLLMGSCDLATTFTGTPYYMSPEVLSHQGYNSKSDIWALGCLLYEMCCLIHAFQGPNFLSVVMKIVEGETPTLPSAYSPDLNSVMQRMLQKQPSSRPSAAEILKTKFMEENMQKMKDRFVFVSSGGDEDAELIAKKMQTKVHLQTLRERTEVEKMTPRERMRLRKQQAADENAERLRKLAEEKYVEIHTRRRELRSRHFENISLDVLNESREDTACQSLPFSNQYHHSAAGAQPIRKQDESEPELQDIPEDPQAAEVYYNQDGFESCSEDEETDTPAETLYLSDPQLLECDRFFSVMIQSVFHIYTKENMNVPEENGDYCLVSDLEAMMKHMQKVLEEEQSVTVKQCLSVSTMKRHVGIAEIHATKKEMRMEKNVDDEKANDYADEKQRC